MASALRVRCGLHAGVAERRDDDFFGSPVNRAARIMSAAHGGQVLVSQAVATVVGDRLPAHARVARPRVPYGCGTSQAPSMSFRSCIPLLRQDFPALRSLEATPEQPPAAG